MNLLEALDEYHRWKREAERLEKVIAEQKDAMVVIADTAAKAAENIRKDCDYALKLLAAVHPAHPQPELCDACGVLGRRGQ